MIIKRALISVSDKTGVVEFAQALASYGRARSSPPAAPPSLLRGSGHPGHRGLRLHRLPGDAGRPGQDPAPQGPRRHPGPARPAARGSHGGQHDIQPIDLVVVNLYPFEQTVAKPELPTCRRHREHRHRRPDHAAHRGQEPRAASPWWSTRPTTPRVLAEMQANGGACQRRHPLRPGGEGLRPHRRATTAPSPTTSARASTPTASAQLSAHTSACSSPRRRTCATARTRTSRPPSTSSTGVQRGLHRHRPPAAGQGTLLQQHRRHRRRAGMREAVRRGTGLRHRQARQPLRRRHRRKPARGLRPRLSRPIPSRPSAASSPSTASWTPPPRSAIVERQFVEVIIAPSVARRRAAAVVAAKKNVRLLACGALAGEAGQPPRLQAGHRRPAGAGRRPALYTELKV